MCGIDFVMALTDREATNAARYIHFNESIHGYLATVEKEEGNDFSLLLNLDPYRQTIIHTKQIPELIAICESLSRTYIKNNTREREIHSFAEELKELCYDALKYKKHIYAIGD